MGIPGEGFWWWVDREKAGSHLGGMGEASFFSQSTSSLSPHTWHQHRHPRSSVQATPLPELPLPSISTWQHTFILHAQFPNAAFSPTPLPGRIICYLFCSLRHIFILTQYNWGMPVRQY